MIFCVWSVFIFFYWKTLVQKSAHCRALCEEVHLITSTDVITERNRMLLACIGVMVELLKVAPDGAGKQNALQ